MFLKLAVFALFVGLAAWAQPAGAAPDQESINGNWNAVFSIAGQTADATFTFSVKGSTVTGTVDSHHTGTGIITDGKWENGKLSCTLKFEKHESIKFWGSFKDGKLSGEFATEGMTGTWTADRKS